jgi:poly(glycerol-phosphate) alpha-glucosyltransferase
MLDTWALSNSRLKKVLALALYERRTLSGASCIHTLAPAETAAVRGLGLRNPICELPNGIDLPADVSVRAPWVDRVPRGCEILLYLGRLHAKKNVAVLLRAWAEAGREDPAGCGKWRLVIVGRGDAGHSRELETLVRELGLRTVLFLGDCYGEDRRAAYACASGFVLPSVSEGLPMSVLEAWSHGLPVIMTPACNLGVGFGEGAAIRIDPTVASTKRGLMELFCMSRDRRRLMGASGLSLIKKRFRWDLIGEQMVSVYEWLLNRGRQPPCVRMLG